MLRLAYALGFGYLGVCTAALIGRPHPPRMYVEPAAVSVTAEPATGARGWFALIRPRCNAVEVEVAMRASPPPAGDEGTGLQAGCYALAGKMDRARELIDGMPHAARGGAAGIVFDIVHPVADAGDDRSAGPMMRLVLAYLPDNFMALYHAGMSEHAMGEHALARTHLERFLQLYRADDGWASNAREVLARPAMKR